MFATFDHAGYSIKNYKECQGRDGYAFSLTLYKDNKRILSVKNSGCGGCNRYHAILPKGTKPEVIGKTKRKRVAKLLETAENVLESNYVEAHDMFIGKLIDDMLNERQLKRFCKKQTLFRLTGDENSYRRINKVYTPAVAVQLRNQAKIQGTEVIEILNEKLG